jgi:beta-N-acetylhexosaminidase
VWLQTVLRGRLGFTGAVFSDDLSMAAARRVDGVELSDADATLAALQAGCDLTLLCNQSVVDEGAAIDKLLERMTEALLKGDWQASESAELRRLALLPASAPLQWDELMVQPSYMHALDSLL